MTRWLLTALPALLLFAAGASAQEPMILGVQTHFAFTPPKTSDAGLFRAWMRRSGFNSARDEMFWWHVEDEYGGLEMKQGAVVTRDLWRSMPPPFHPLLTLDFGYRTYDAGGQPKSPAARAAFSRYAGFVVSQSQPVVRLVEVWNEWNLKAGARPEGGSNGDAEDYVRLSAATYQHLKQLDPAIKVLVGAISDDFPDWRWLRSAMNLGLLSRADGLSVHLYNYCMAPSRIGADELIQRLDALRAILDTAGHPSLPVYVTEVGWPTHQGKCAVTESDAAVHSMRFLLEASLRQWVRGVWYYELQDGGSNPADPEHHFGLLRRDGSEKPGGCALREMGAQVARRPKSFTRVDGVTMARFGNGATDRYVFWTSPAPGGASEAQARLTARSAKSGPLRAVSVCGLDEGVLTLEPDGRSAVVAVQGRTVLVIDRPTGETLALESLR